MKRSLALLALLFLRFDFALQTWGDKYGSELPCMKVIPALRKLCQECEAQGEVVLRFGKNQCLTRKPLQ